MRCPGFAHFLYHADTRTVELIRKSCVSNTGFYKEKKSHGEILCEIGMELVRYIFGKNIKVFARERAITRFATETQVLHKVVGVTDALLFLLQKVEFQELTASQIRKLVVGYGTAGKDVLAAALDSYFEHPEFKNYDESDACGVAVGWLIENGYLDPVHPTKEGEDQCPTNE